MSTAASDSRRSASAALGDISERAALGAVLLSPSTGSNNRDSRAAQALLQANALSCA
jgi:hypothetical protein